MQAGIGKLKKQTRVLSLLVIGFLIVMAAAALLFLRGLGVRDRARNAVSTLSAVISSRSVRALSQGEYRNIVFLHHSVGNNLVEQGDLQKLFREAGYSLYDQGYNNQGMRGPDGASAGFAYPVPNDNTDPDGLSVVFTQPLRDLPVNTFSGLLQHEVVIIKSCFPNNNIGSAESLQNLQEMYLGIRQTMQAHPDKLFIIMTTPPLNPAETNLENAARARAMAAWLTSGAFVDGSQNIAVFDFYALLAEDDAAAPDANMLKASFRDGSDSHPNLAANRQIAPIFVEFVTGAAQAFRAGQP